MNAYRFLTPALVVGLLLVASMACATDTDYLKAKLSFRYVDQPNTITSTPAVLNNTAISAGTESGAFWSSRSVPGLQGLVRSLLRPPERGGNMNLQYVVAGVVKILDRPVLITLLNDATPLTQDALDQWEACPEESSYAWPCARNASVIDDARQACAEAQRQAVPGRQDARWAGSMTLGQHVFNSTRAGNPLGTFVHELVHTQDRSDGAAHMFLVSQNSYNYGDDGQHFYTEAVPNLATTYQEGIADAVMLMVDGQINQRMFDWFSRNDVMMVEKTALTPGTGAGQAPCGWPVTSPSPDIWLYNQLHAAGVREVHPRNALANYAYFRVRDLPPRFIVHNEFIIALVFSEYARHLGLSNFLNVLKANDATLFRTCASSIAVLYDALSRSGMGGGRPQQTFLPPGALTGRPDDQPKPYLIPLAYADYFTSYNSTTKEQYASIFENMLPHDWVDLYWNLYKDRVRLAAPLGPTLPPRRQHLTDIAIALGVNTSTAEPARLGP